MPSATASDPSERRPVFRDGQLLDAPALQAEQQARTAALARHESRVHTTDDRTLRAAAVTAPSGRSRIVLGGSRLLSAQLADGNGGFREVTTVHSDGGWNAGGPATVSGSVTVSGKATLSDAIPAPQAASPWSLYRTTVPVPGKPGTEQFRLEAGEVRSGDDPTAVQALIASTGKTLLQIDGNGTVTIPGHLYVDGYITIRGGSGADGGGIAPANIDLTATNQGTVHPRIGRVHYTLQLATSAATAVTAITVYQTVTAGGTATRTTVDSGRDLPSATTKVYTQYLPSSPVTVDVLAIGVGQDGRERSATLHFTT